MKFMEIFCGTSDLMSRTVPANFFFFFNKLSAWSSARIEKLMERKHAFYPQHAHSEGNCTVNI